MKTFRSLIAIIVVAFVLDSCTPEDVMEDRSQQPANHKSFLSKLYIIDSTSPAQIDSMLITTFTYDNLKRVTSQVDSDYYQHWRIREERHYFYNGIDMLPYKSTDVFHGFEPPSAIGYFFYNSAGQRIRDSIFTDAELGVNSKKLTRRFYSYNGSKMTDTSFDIAIINPNAMDRRNIHDSAILDSQGNVVYNLRSVYDSLNNPIGQVESRITVDNHPNPFPYITDYQRVDLFPDGYFHFHQKNNLLRLVNTVQWPGGTNVTDLDYTGHYIYNAQGYPIEITYMHLATNPPSTRFRKYQFIYKAL